MHSSGAEMWFHAQSCLVLSCGALNGFSTTDPLDSSSHAQDSTELIVNVHELNDKDEPGPTIPVEFKHST